MWQDIETAPKDGQNILIAASCHPEDYAGHIYIGFWSQADSLACEGVFEWCDWGAGIDDEDYWHTIPNAHFWMPLPEPPKDT